MSRENEIKVSYTLHENHLNALFTMLGLDDYENSIDFQALINKGFIVYKDNRIAVDPIVAFVLKEYRQGLLFKVDGDVKVYEGKHLVISEKKKGRYYTLSTYKNRLDYKRSKEAENNG
ncbi:MAG: hypothetical protein HUJ56_01090 [Erysipelotrichaceae bacterium]|nr:hypothetical protein [Erysipelotrichaceae bacterium]